MIAIHNSATGEIAYVASLAGVDLAVWAVVADPAPADVATAPYKVADGVLVPDLDAAKARQRSIINAARDAAQDGGAVTPFGVFDSSERSLTYLNGAIKAAEKLAALELPSDTNWTRADNVNVTLTVTELTTAGLAVAAHINAMHQRGRVLKSRIDAATTLAEIAAIGWTLED
jgi:Domain of unknown function (DUF4376)